MSTAWEPDQATLDLIRHVALQNTLEYNGKAAVGSVIGRIMAMRDDLKQHGKQVTGLVAAEVNRANGLAKENGLDAVRASSKAKLHSCSKNVKQRFDVKD